MLLRIWPESEFRRTGVLEELTSTLSKTLQDADNEARSTAREGFFCLSDKFPEEAERVKADLPPQAQKMLKQSSLSRTGSQDSLASTGSAASSHGSVRTPGGRGRPRNLTGSLSRVPGSRTPKFTPKPRVVTVRFFFETQHGYPLMRRSFWYAIVGSENAIWL